MSPASRSDVYLDTYSAEMIELGNSYGMFAGHSVGCVGPDVPLLPFVLAFEVNTRSPGTCSADLVEYVVSEVIDTAANDTWASDEPGPVAFTCVPSDKAWVVGGTSYASSDADPSDFLAVLVAGIMAFGGVIPCEVYSARESTYESGSTILSDSAESNLPSDEKGCIVWTTADSAGSSTGCKAPDWFMWLGRCRVVFGVCCFVVRGADLVGVVWLSVVTTAMSV